MSWKRLVLLALDGVKKFKICWETASTQLMSFDFAGNPAWLCLIENVWESKTHSMTNGPKLVIENARDAWTLKNVKYRDNWALIPWRKKLACREVARLVPAIFVKRAKAFNLNFNLTWGYNTEEHDDKLQKYRMRWSWSCNRPLRRRGQKHQVLSRDSDTEEQPNKHQMSTSTGYNFGKTTALLISLFPLKCEAKLSSLRVCQVMRPLRDPPTTPTNG
jgi:hypothetical protein